jgi:hypothetical protein
MAAPEQDSTTSRPEIEPAGQCGIQGGLGELYPGYGPDKHPFFRFSQGKIPRIEELRVVIRFGQRSMEDEQ